MYLSLNTSYKYSMIINNFSIKEIPIVLTELTIPQSYYHLIDNAVIYCNKLDELGYKYTNQLLEIQNNHNRLEELCQKTSIQFTYLQSLIKLLAFNQYKPFPIKKIESLSKKEINKFLNKGYKKSDQILLIGKTKEDRKKVAKEVGVPVDCVTKLIKMADLMRLPGVKYIRANLYYEAGLDYVQKFIGLDLDKTREYLTAFVKDTHVAKMAPLKKELATHIMWSQIYPIQVEFE
ncbi:hypothetical protein SH1V18_37990 [Vallitalea longa]|uniref:DUF4332 domain-containing protein n=1 Tax=Vallitalea longa TaxID=2936439 RepID=A0A9W5YE06_9FIRM|nr:DUF4332 domain-containing protein [Vallitalea longa]GKX31319.1 hypothetical protein SH1V18_37990 [Vallitalea longa]